MRKNNHIDPLFRFDTFDEKGKNTNKHTFAFIIFMTIRTINFVDFNKIKVSTKCFIEHAKLAPHFF